MKHLHVSRGARRAALLVALAVASPDLAAPVAARPAPVPGVKTGPRADIPAFQAALRPIGEFVPHPQYRSWMESPATFRRTGSPTPSASGSGMRRSAGTSPRPSPGPRSPTTTDAGPTSPRSGGCGLRIRNGHRPGWSGAETRASWDGDRSRRTSRGLRPRRRCLRSLTDLPVPGCSCPSRRSGPQTSPNAGSHVSAFETSIPRPTSQAGPSAVAASPATSRSDPTCSRVIPRSGPRPCRHLESRRCPV